MYFSSNTFKKFLSGEEMDYVLGYYMGFEIWLGQRTYNTQQRDRKKDEVPPWVFSWLGHTLHLWNQLSYRFVAQQANVKYQVRQESSKLSAVGACNIPSQALLNEATA